VVLTSHFTNGGWPHPDSEGLPPSRRLDRAAAQRCLE